MKNKETSVQNKTAMEKENTEHTGRARRKSRLVPLHISFAAIFTALIAVCAMISIPLGNIKFSLQLFAVLLAAGLLPLYDSLPSVAAYILLGALGVPIFAGFSGGAAVLAGPTGGFIYGFLLTDLVVWLILRLCKARRFWQILAAFTAGTLVCYLCGSLHFFFYAPDKGLPYILSVCVLPYLLPDAVKIVVAALIVCKVEPHLHKLLS